jgi:hypothetical protein
MTRAGKREMNNSVSHHGGLVEAMRAGARLLEVGVEC